MGCLNKTDKRKHCFHFLISFRRSYSFFSWLLHCYLLSARQKRFCNKTGFRASAKQLWLSVDFRPDLPGIYSCFPGTAMNVKLVAFSTGSRRARRFRFQLVPRAITAKRLVPVARKVVSAIHRKCYPLDRTYPVDNANHLSCNRGLMTFS